MDVQQIDPRDDADFAAFFAVFAAATELSRPGEPSWLRHEEQVRSVAGLGADADTARHCLTVRDGGQVVGAVRLELPQRDNLHVCEFDLAVHPDHRRRGVGTLLEQALVEHARSCGRTTLISYVDEPPAAARTDRAFGLARGYQVAQQEVRRDIDLPLPPHLVAALERPAPGYRLLTWWDAVPEEHLADRAELSRVMSIDVPLDEVDVHEEVWDGARIRREERVVQQMDRTFVAVGAVHEESGSMVAYTTMGVPKADRRRAYQWDTLVVRAHRGHGLGALVKLAALRELAAASPGTRYVSTWNAAENTHMIAINDALGARTNGAVVAMQKLLA